MTSRVEPQQLVRDYYRHIDAGDLTSALAAFAADASYRRPGYEPLRGIDAIRGFYENDRVIAGGQHRLELIVSDGPNVAVRGTFAGVAHDGRDLAVRFADFWRFSGEQVVERSTYFDAAAV